MSRPTPETWRDEPLFAIIDSSHAFSSCPVGMLPYYCCSATTPPLPPAGYFSLCLAAMPVRRYRCDIHPPARYWCLFTPSPPPHVTLPRPPARFRGAITLNIDAAFHPCRQIFFAYDRNIFHADTPLRRSRQLRHHAAGADARLHRSEKVYATFQRLPVPPHAYRHQAPTPICAECAFSKII